MGVPHLAALDRDPLGLLGRARLPAEDPDSAHCKVIVAHADRTARDHALRETVLHVGRQIDDFTAYTWYEPVDAADHRSNVGLRLIGETPAPGDG